MEWECCDLFFKRNKSILRIYCGSNKADEYRWYVVVWAKKAFNKRKNQIREGKQAETEEQVDSEKAGRESM